MMEQKKIWRKSSKKVSLHRENQIRGGEVSFAKMGKPISGCQPALNRFSYPADKEKKSEATPCQAGSASIAALVAS